MLQDKQAEMISGKQEIVKRFDLYLPITKRKKLYFAELTSLSDSFDPTNLEFTNSSCSANKEDSSKCGNFRKATVADCDPLYDLKEQIEEFELGKTARESFRQTLRSGTGNAYFFEEAGEVLASASTTAENSFSAMVVGVCTHPKARRRGLATQCVRQLCDELLNEGKLLCLLYDNPAAGSIYRRIGFQEIGLWCMNYIG
ncbi:GNAT family N-acetyltransferase [Brevibacillus ginsengisoli]|uniref:GNAT family N-acetyltransferase n=1 Tax=Brevibacillus ginsengisoli TaxID=363854 RepID=UPI003CEB8336